MVFLNEWGAEARLPANFILEIIEQSGNDGGDGFDVILETGEKLRNLGVETAIFGTHKKEKRCSLRASLRCSRHAER